VRAPLSYVLPIRSERAVDDELFRYLAAVAPLAEVIVVDGSPSALFEDFKRRCPEGVRHVAPDSDLRGFVNGKVAGVVTGVRLASHEPIVIADDDVRYDAGGLAAMKAALDTADVVRPQNYFDPMPWHACVDTARTLLNRVTGGDWPGTLGLRRSTLMRAGGYDGNVMFENLELVRTIRAVGGKEVCPLDLYVRRLPPDTHHFWGQRVRQAYDEFARPGRLIAWLCVLPAVGAMAAASGGSAILLLGALAAVTAETGRRRAGGARVFPVAASMAAPLWIAERALCAWMAVAARVMLGGIPYRGRVVKKAATPLRQLQQRYGEGR
jgi:hypothetical protein